MVKTIHSEWDMYLSSVDVPDDILGDPARLELLKFAFFAGAYAVLVILAEEPNKRAEEARFDILEFELDEYRKNMERKVEESKKH